MYDTFANASLELSEAVYSSVFLQDQWNNFLDIIGKYLLFS